MHRLATIILFAVVCGCSQTPYDVAEVSGRVTLDGQPLGDAVVMFQPTTSRAGQTALGPGSHGTTDTEGRYALRLIDPDREGAVVATHRVTITTAREVNPDSESGEMTPEKVPARYRDGSLTFDVPADGTSRADFELSSVR